MTLVEKIRTKQVLTEDDVYAIWNNKEGIQVIDEKVVDTGRWMSTIEFIIELPDIDNEYYSLWFLQGLTEYQEDEFEEQVAERVRRVTKMVEVTTWKSLKEE